MQLTTLLSGYQDLMDRYGTDDPLVLQMKEEIERRKLRPALPVWRRHRVSAVRAGEWSTQPQGSARLA